MTASRTPTPVSLSFHADAYSGPAHFAVNVKCHRYIPTPGIEDDAGQESVMEWAREAFWADLNTLAVETFGPGAEVCAEGQSGGWAVPYVADKGLTADMIAEDAGLRRKAVRFVRHVERMMKRLIPDYVKPAMKELLDRRAERKRERDEAHKAAMAVYYTRRAALYLLADHLSRPDTYMALPDAVRNDLAHAGVNALDDANARLYVADLIAAPAPESVA